MNGLHVGSIYALVALGTSTLLFLLVYGKQEIMTSRYLTIYEQVMNYCDAVGLGIFTVLGVYTAHSEGYHGIFFLVFLGMMTGIVTARSETRMSQAGLISTTAG